MAHHSAVTSCLYCTNNPSPPLSPSGPAFSGAHPIVITFANLSNVHFCGKVTNCSLCYCICILNEENPSDEALALFFWTWLSSGINNHGQSSGVQCVKYARVTTRVPLPLPIGCLLTVFPLSLLMSVIHSAETESWPLNVIALFRLESIFCCFACCERFSTPGQLFLIILFHFGCLPQRTSPHITPHLCTWRYTLSPLSPQRWSYTMRQMQHTTGHLTFMGHYSAHVQ